MTEQHFNRVNQFLASAVPGDAIFHEALMLRDALRTWGCRADIYCESRYPNFTDKEARYHHAHRPRTDELIILHHSIGSEVGAYIERLLSTNNPPPIMLIYHNITPPEFLQGLGNKLQRQTREGREQLTYFRDKVTLAVADSEYNRQELVEAGYPRTRVLPLALNESLYQRTPDKRVLQQFDDDYANWLFVGRIAPNKKQEDVIKCLYHYKQFNPQSRLFLVGSWAGTERYYHWLQTFVQRLGLTDDVHFSGYVSQEALTAYYQLADIFVCMSEHEGFCVPLLESMYFRVPVVAYATGAVPETLGPAGVLIKCKHYGIISAVIDLILTDANIRQQLCNTQTARLQDFTTEKVLAIFEKLLLWVTEKEN